MGEKGDLRIRQEACGVCVSIHFTNSPRAPAYQPPLPTPTLPILFCPGVPPRPPPLHPSMIHAYLRLRQPLGDDGGTGEVNYLDRVEKLERAHQRVGG
jgi:hypothetical protein